MRLIEAKSLPSTVDGKEGDLYFQIAQNRAVRQLNTDYKVFADECDVESESVVINGNHSNFLLGIQDGSYSKAIVPDPILLKAPLGSTPIRRTPASLRLFMPYFSFVPISYAGVVSPAFL